MPAPLFGQPLLQRLHQRLEPAQGLYLGPFLGCQMPFAQLFQPRARQVQRLQHLVCRDRRKPGEAAREGAVEAVDPAFVLDHGQPGQVIEGLGVISDQTRRHPFQKGQEFAHRHRHPLFPQGLEERQEHRA